MLERSKPKKSTSSPTSKPDKPKTFPVVADVEAMMDELALTGRETLKVMDAYSDHLPAKIVDAPIAKLVDVPIDADGKSHWTGTRLEATRVSDFINIWGGNIAMPFKGVDGDGWDLDLVESNDATTQAVTDNWKGATKKIYAKYLFEPMDKITIDSIHTDLSEAWGTIGNLGKEYRVRWNEFQIAVDQSFFYAKTDGSTGNSTTLNINTNTATGITVNYEPFINITGADIPLQVFERRRKPRYSIPRRNRTSLRPGAENEEKARRLLQRLIGFRRFARYIRDGFVAHKGKSGRIFQVYPGHTHMKVWEQGEHIESWCLCIKDGKVPPTDSVVMRLLMLEHSEDQYRELSNVSNHRRNVPTIDVDNDQWIFRVDNDAVANDNIMAVVA